MNIVKTIRNTIVGALLGVSLFISCLYNKTNIKTAEASNPSSPIRIDWTNGTIQPKVNDISFSRSNSGDFTTFSGDYYAYKTSGGYLYHTSIFDAGMVFSNISITVYGAENRDTPVEDNLIVSLIDTDGDLVNDFSISHPVKYASMPARAYVNEVTINGDCHEDYVFNSVSTKDYGSITGIKILIDGCTSNYVIRRVVINYTLQSDNLVVQSFVDDYLYMNTYTGDGSGYCKDDEHHYYLSAKEAFNDLNDFNNKYLKWIVILL